jgi:hypothetical protein
MRCRQTIELSEAEKCQGPRGLRGARTAAQKWGLRYEKLVAKRTEGLHGQWWKFRDLNGEGYCQTDIVLTLDGRAYVLEVKLTDVDEAYDQLRGLYLPVVSMALAKPTFGIVVVRHLTPRALTKPIYTSLGAAMLDATPREFPLVHWIGRGPL